MRRLACLALLVLAGCATVPTALPVIGSGNCRNDGLERFTGQLATSDLGAEMLTVSGARVIRWAAMGMMLTMDYRADRLTVRLSADNHVMSATCG